MSGRGKLNSNLGEDRLFGNEPFELVGVVPPFTVDEENILGALSKDSAP